LLGEPSTVETFTYIFSIVPLECQCTAVPHYSKKLFNILASDMDSKYETNGTVTGGAGSYVNLLNTKV
jgi:hypothetical protein